MKANTLSNHLVRWLFWASLLLLAVGNDAVWLSSAAAAGLFVTSFAVFHDASHGALGLSRRTNDALLFLAGIPVLFSAHAQRQLHMRHHARPLAEDDVEAAGARVSFWEAVALVPRTALRIHTEGLRAVPARLRTWVVVEDAVNVVVAGIGLTAFGRAGQAAVITVLFVQATMTVWAAHIPHHPWPWLMAIARRLSSLRSPVVLSLLFHMQHHAIPRVPCAELPDVLAHHADVHRA